MNICYRIRLFRATLVKDKSLACLVPLLSNVSVETHVDLTASKSLIKGVNIQKSYVLMFSPIFLKYVNEHQPFQLNMISKLVSIEWAKGCYPNDVASIKYRDNEGKNIKNDPKKVNVQNFDKQKMCLFLMSQGSFSLKNRFLRQKVWSVARGTDGHESENRGPLSGFQDFHQGAVQHQQTHKQQKHTQIQWE